MKVTMKKRTLYTVIAILLIVVIIISGIFVFQIVSTNLTIKETEKKLSQIDSKELEKNLIEKLKKSKLYVEIDKENTYIGTMFNEGTSFKGYISVAYLCFENGNFVGAIEIPCFKINSTNGKFKNIEYTTQALGKYLEIETIIEDIFKNEYGIEITKTWGWNQFNGNFNRKYNKTFNTDCTTNKGNIYIDIDSQNFFTILEEVTGIKAYKYGDIIIDREFKEYSTKTIGMIQNNTNISENISNNKNVVVENKNPIVTMEIKDYGTVKIELYPDVAPNTVNNFINLVNNGFYDNLTFHRVIKDFMIQGGDKNGDGTGNPNLSDLKNSIPSNQDKEYAIKGEFEANGYNNSLKHTEGVISMARADYSSLGKTEEGYNSAGSQFFIVTKTATSLDGAYASFGKVIEGMDIIHKIESLQTNENEEPTEKVIIKSIKVDTFGKKYELPDTIDVFDINSYLSTNY